MKKTSLYTHILIIYFLVLKTSFLEGTRVKLNFYFFNFFKQRN